jgi:dipeptidyl aminopeptidase/acylaminoacyl peptidase
MSQRFPARWLAAPRWTGALIAAIVFATLSIGSPHASPGSGKIVFEARGNILAANEDGIGLRVLSAYGRDPSVSRDGTKIAFDRYSGAADHIVVMRADGTAARRVGSAAGRLRLWSPDGSRIAYSGPVYSGDIYVVDADGKATRHVVTDADKFGFAWSPNGRQIVYSAEDGIAVVEVDGSQRQVLLTPSDESAWRPTWSRDGDQIAARRLRSAALLPLGTQAQAASTVQRHCVPTRVTSSLQWRATLRPGCSTRPVRPAAALSSPHCWSGDREPGRSKWRWASTSASSMAITSPASSVTAHS